MQGTGNIADAFSRNLVATLDGGKSGQNPNTTLTDGGQKTQGLWPPNTPSSPTPSALFSGETQPGDNTWALQAMGFCSTDPVQNPDAPASGAATGTMSDDQLLELANKNPVYVDGKALHQFDGVLQAAKNGLIDIVSPQEFERQLRFQNEHGSTEYSSSWTAADRDAYQFACTPQEKEDISQSKWAGFVNQKYMQYLQGKSDQWDQATRIMSAAANVGNWIAGGTMAVVGAIGAAGAIPAIGGASSLIPAGTAAAPLAEELEGAAPAVNQLIQGPYGTVSRSALQAAANYGGSTVRVVTRLTQMPQAGRALSTAVGDGAEELASAAGATRQVFEAQIPKALIDALQQAGLANYTTTNMGGVQATELRFLPQATEFVVGYFKNAQ